MNGISVTTPSPGTSASGFLAAFRSTADRKVLSILLHKWIVCFVAGFLAISTFEGALRFYTAQAGLPWLVYSKDVLLVAALCLGMLTTLVTDLRNLPFLVTAILLLTGTAIGIAVLADIRQPLFAAKTWLPLLCGTVSGAAVAAHPRFLARICWFLWLAAVVGIVLTSTWRAPWVGFVYEVGGMVVEGSREWTIGDSIRAAGFSRASFDAALQCLFFGAIIVTMARRYIVGLGVWLISAGAMYLTVSRTALLALVVAMGLHFLVVSLKSTQRCAKLAVVLLAATVLAIPFVSHAYYKNKAGMADTTTIASSSSFEDRAIRTWPDGLALSSQGGHWLTGRGLGGIGVAQQFFEPNIFNPGDNLFVYLWGAFGTLGVLFLGFIAWQAWRAQVPFDKLRQGGVLLIGAFLAVGLTLNGIEAAVASLFLGIGLRWVTERRQAE